MPVWVSNIALTLLLAAFWPLSALLDEYLDPYFLSVLINIGIAIILATSLNLVNGITGQFSLGHAGFMGVGAYGAGIVFKHYYAANSSAPLLFLGVLLLGGILAAVAGLLIGIPSLRLRGDYLAIATLGFGEIIVVIARNVEFIGPFEVGGSSGLKGLPIVTNFFWTYTWVVICVVAMWRITHSEKGLALKAVREDEIAASAMGLDTTFYKVSAFVIGAFFAGVAGGLQAMHTSVIDPGSFNFMRSVEIVVMVVLGGSGSITGSILAATVLTWLPEQLRAFQNWRMIVYSLVLIIMMLVRPEGLLGRRELWWTRRRLAPGLAGDNKTILPPTDLPVP